MEITSAIEFVRYQFPRDVNIIHDFHEDLERRLDALREIYGVLKEEGGGASFEFKDGRGNSLSYSAEMNHGKGYGHDLVYAFLEASAGLIKNIAREGLPNGLDSEIARLIVSSERFKPEEFLSDEYLAHFDGTDGIKVDVYDKGQFWSDRNIWAEFMDRYLGEGKRMQAPVLGTGRLLQSDAPHNGLRKKDLRDILGKAVADAGFKAEDMKNYDIAVSPIQRQIVYR